MQLVCLRFYRNNNFLTRLEETNMKKLTKNNVIILLLVFFTVFAFKADLFAQKTFEGYWESETISQSNFSAKKAPKTINMQKIYYKKGKMKIVDFSDNSTTIFRLDKGLSWEIDHNNKTYSEMRFEDMEKNLKAAKTEMAQKIQELSKEDQEMMKKMMGGKLSKMLEGKMPTVSFKNTGKTKTINGYKCSQVLMYLDNEPLMEMWLTPKYNMGDDFIKIYQKMGFIKGEVPAESQLKGFPIYNKMEMNMGMGNMVSETTVKKIVPTKISDSEFEVPKGYKKIKMKNLFK